MSEQWKKWEGQLVDGKLVLGQCLANSEFNAVFLTQLSDPPGQRAVLKLVAAGSPAAEVQVGLWKRAAHLTHPNLLTIFDAGRCRLDDLPFIYAVMEFAEENLGEILPQRALTADEVRDVLDPALDVHPSRVHPGTIRPPAYIPPPRRVPLGLLPLSPPPRLPKGNK